MFQYYQPTKIYFGSNRLEELGQIAARYGTRCLLVTSPDEPLRPLYLRVTALLQAQGISVLHFDQVQPNPSVEIVEQGFELIRQNPVDFVLAVGGGSSIDTAKSIAFTNGQECIDWDYLFQTYSSPYEDYAPYSQDRIAAFVCADNLGYGIAGHTGGRHYTRQGEADLLPSLTFLQSMYHRPEAYADTACAHDSCNRLRCVYACV